MAMIKRRKPLRHIIFGGTLAFILLLSIILGCVQFSGYENVLYSHYEQYIGSILRYVSSEIDTDDLAQCIRSGEKSDRYHALQTLLDTIKEQTGIHFIYIVIPLNTETYDNVQNVIAGATHQEYEQEPDALVQLNSLTGDSYSVETAEKYLNAYESGKMSFFEDASEWGNDYTGLLPLFDKEGNRVAALCVDIEIAEIQTTLRRDVLKGVSVILALGFAFLASFLLWTWRNVTRPLEALEKSAVSFASMCRDQKDPDALRLDTPLVHVNNEIETLTEAVVEMSEAMREYVKGMVTAENAARSAEKITELTESISSLLHNMPCLSFSKDAESGVYLACNQAFAEYAHKSCPEEVVGLMDKDIFDPTTAEHFVEDDQIALSSDQPYIFFEDVVDAAGNPRQFRTTKLKYIDSTGRLCTLGMCVDVTEMVRVEQENAQTKKAYESARRSGVMYSRIARALAYGYTDLFYVNLETEEFIEYLPNSEHDSLFEARRGAGFFENCKLEAQRYVLPADRELFSRAMERETLLAALDRNNSFLMTYRLVGEKEPIYVSMKVSRMRDDKKYIIIGVTDIDEQMKQQRAAERMKEERIAYARINALTGNFICVYIVDPETGRFRQYSALTDFSSLGIPTEGEDFFRTAREQGSRAVYPDDLNRYMSLFTRKDVLAEIKRSGIFTLSYRLMLEGEPLNVQLKAAMVEEQEGTRLIVGVNDVDAHVRQEEEYARRLAKAQSEANIDVLTGVKNRHAYLKLEEYLDHQIENHRQQQFAIVILDVNNLKFVNDTAGHQAGDQFLRDSCETICTIFPKSAVYRVGGDEFAVVMQGCDDKKLDALMRKMDELNAKAVSSGGIVIACGFAKFDNDANVATVFARADKNMYKNKMKLKTSST